MTKSRMAHHRAGTILEIRRCLEASSAVTAKARSRRKKSPRPPRRPRLRQCSPRPVPRRAPPARSSRLPQPRLRGACSQPERRRIQRKRLRRTCLIRRFDLSTRAMSETEAKQRANRRFDVAERRSREEATRIAEQKKAEVSDAAKIQRLRAL